MASPVAGVQQPVLAYYATLSGLPTGRMFPTPNDESSLDGLLREATVGVDSRVRITVRDQYGQRPVTSYGRICYNGYSSERPLTVGFNHHPGDKLRRKGYNEGDHVAVELRKPF